MTETNNSTAGIDAANAAAFDKAVSLLKHRDSSKENLQTFFAEDDVMREHFGNGDPFLVDTNVKEFLFDGIYVFRVGSQEWVRRLQFLPEGIEVSGNITEYERWMITDDMDFEVLGMVVKAWKSHRLC